ncbi:unnamed protein product [Nesidiocoris tenuis]|uniref:Uncharacterized protein n=1 Tax=Nesidiocoris tenuis TaxID=355587 RepID=A0A6H5FXD6_9HEMI|nr:unnamed protein product [Nesidiocoris tenuis]
MRPLSRHDGRYWNGSTGTVVLERRYWIGGTRLAGRCGDTGAPRRVSMGGTGTAILERWYWNGGTGTAALKRWYWNGGTGTSVLDWRY